MANSRVKRPKTPVPLDLAEMEQDPSMRGMLSFLEISPAEKLEMLRRRAHIDAVETTQQDTVADSSTDTVSQNQSDMVAADPPDTVAIPPEQTVAVKVTRGTAPLWCAEANAGIFPNSRVRRIVHARDTLTRTEQAVYDILWSSGGAGDRERLSSAGYDVVARQAGVTKMNAKYILERLIEKGFLKVASLPDPLRRIPTRYRVFSDAVALEHMVRSNRLHVVRTGNGILFVHVLPTTVVVDIPATVSAVPAASIAVDPPEMVAVHSQQPVCDEDQGSPSDERVARVPAAPSK